MSELPTYGSSLVIERIEVKQTRLGAQLRESDWPHIRITANWDGNATATVVPFEDVPAIIAWLQQAMAEPDIQPYDVSEITGFGALHPGFDHLPHG